MSVASEHIRPVRAGNDPTTATPGSGAAVIDIPTSAIVPASTIAPPSAIAPTANTTVPVSIEEHRAGVLRRRDEAECLGDDIAELSARIQAATYELLVMLRAFDEREGWSRLPVLRTLAELAHRTGPGRRPREGARGPRAGRPPAAERRDAAGAALVLQGAGADAGGDAGQRAAAARFRGMRAGLLRRASGAGVGPGRPAGGGGRRAAAARTPEPEHLGRRRWDGGDPRAAVARGGCCGAAGAGGGGRPVADGRLCGGSGRDQLRPAAGGRAGTAGGKRPVVRSGPGNRGRSVPGRAARRAGGAAGRYRRAGGGCFRDRAAGLRRGRRRSGHGVVRQRGRLRGDAADRH